MLFWCYDGKRENIEITNYTDYHASGSPSKAMAPIDIELAKGCIVVFLNRNSISGKT